MERDGFIHCSMEKQLLRVANLYFCKNDGIVILKIDPLRLGPELRWEAGTDNVAELYPHIYGRLNLNAVIEEYDFEKNPDGLFFLPQGFDGN